MAYLGNSPAQITVDGFTFNDPAAAELDWVFDDIDGWHSGPGVRLERVERSTSHGEFGQPGQRTGRTITVNGWVAANTRGPVAAAVKQLAGLLADGGFDTFTFYDIDEDTTLSAEVQLLAAPGIRWLTGTHADFQLQLFAPDSYRYGPLVSASTGFATTPSSSGLVFPLFDSPGSLNFGSAPTTGTVSLTNAGNATAWPQFVVNGPTAPEGFQIIELATGRSITYLGQCPAGAQVVFDTSDGSVVLDGTADRRGDTLIGAAWPEIPPESTREYLFVSLGAATAATLTARVAPTHW